MNSITSATSPTQRKTRREWESRQQTPLLVSKGDAATILSLCVRTIDKLISSKQLPARRCGKRVLIPYSALVQFAKRDHVTKAAEPQ